MACRPKDKEYELRRRQAQLVAVRERQKRHRETHREEIRAYLASWREKNPDYNRQWRIKRKLELSCSNYSEPDSSSL